MNSYDGVNNSWGTHTVEITLQYGKYKGYMIYQVHGNCRGLDVFPSDWDDLDAAETKGMSITAIAGGFRVCLYSDDGDMLEFDIETESELERMIVSMRIIDFKEN